MIEPSNGKGEANPAAGTIDDLDDAATTSTPTVWWQWLGERGSNQGVT